MALVIHLTAGTPQVGLWCPDCALPSGYMLPLYTLCADGPRRMATVGKCSDCDRPLLPGPTQ